MSGALDFGYAQARVQARYAALPGETEWQRLAAARSLGAYLEEARVGPLGPWLKGISTVSEAHDVERGIRSLAWEQVHEVARWVPRAWGPAVRWVAWLPYLAVFEAHARADPLPPWAPQDARLQEVLEVHGAPPHTRPCQRDLTPLLAPGDSEQMESRWLQGWQDRWPASGRRHTRPLRAFGHELDAHLRVFHRASPDTAWDLRRQLRERLRLRLHQRLLQPLAVFLYLALVLLDLERLRGELLRRCLFSPAARDDRRAEARDGKSP
ncbi:MAG: hypothetical protein WAK53_00020 [Chromatiaceae bacterium]|jgi:hypothetical protein